MATRADGNRLQRQHPSCNASAQKTALALQRRQADYDADPRAWLEYGAHPQGIANTRRREEEMAAEAELREMGEQRVSRAGR